MADVYAMTTDADPALVARIAEVLELRAADPRQQAMRRTYLADIAVPDRARVLEVGCGTRRGHPRAGHLARGGRGHRHRPLPHLPGPGPPPRPAGQRDLRRG